MCEHAHSSGSPTKRYDTNLFTRVCGQTQYIPRLGVHLKRGRKKKEEEIPSGIFFFCNGDGILFYNSMTDGQLVGAKGSLPVAKSFESLRAVFIDGPG